MERFWYIKDKICRWSQRKRKKSLVSVCSKLLVVGSLIVGLSVAPAISAPTDGVVTSGGGAITQSGTATNINQTTNRLDINWGTFSSETKESINFFQPGAASLAINRVVGGVPSELRGALTANGRVFIFNNAGITFFGTSQVNVGSLLATTADITDEDGDLLSFSTSAYGKVLNYGNIHVSDSGFAILAAPFVENTGYIQANLGEIHLASATTFSLDLRGDGLIRFIVSEEILDSILEEGDTLGIDNSGTLKAGGGTVAMTAALASEAVQSVVNFDGVIDASAFTPDGNGGTVLITSVGHINNAGTIHADADKTGDGGYVYT
ncbi:MAG: filamentous hemagglutinin N-terminal domain-containing protein, partial [Thermodesulfobacteriota bacterium]